MVFGSPTCELEVGSSPSEFTATIRIDMFLSTTVKCVSVKVELVYKKLTRRDGSSSDWSEEL